MVKVIPEITYEEDEVDGWMGEKPKKSRRKRELVFDEELGEVVAVRRRKRGGAVDEWESFE